MNISDVTRAVDAKDAAQQKLREMLALIEDTSNYIAKATRGITTATPERRKLREEMERSLADFLTATASPDAARAYTVQPETTVSLMLSQSMTASIEQAAASLAIGKRTPAEQATSAAVTA